MFWNVCLQVHPTIVSHFELTSATENTYIYVRLLGLPGLLVRLLS